MIRRTILVAPSFPPQVGGIERYLEVLAAACDPSQLTVVAPPTTGDSTRDAGCAYTVIRRDLLAGGWLRPSWVRHLPWFLRTIRAGKFSRLVFGGYSGAVSLGPIAKVVLGVPFLVMFHGKDFLAYRQTAVRRALLRWNCARAEWIFVNSSFTSGLLRDFGVPAGKIIIAHPSVPPHQPSTDDDRRRLRRQFHLEDSPILLTVGRLVPRKGHAAVLRALPLVIKNIPTVRYLIIGDGPERERLQRMALQLTIADHVRFATTCNDRERGAAYDCASAFIMLPEASRHDAEGFGIVFLEAMAAGLPVITNASAGVRDIIHDHDHGVVLDEQANDQGTASAIIQLLKDESRRRQLAAHGRALVQSTFTPTAQVAPWRAVLAALPARPSSPPRISVIIPYWNVHDVILKTLHSLQLQTYRDYETIVVDDGSTEPAENFLKAFPSVQVIRQEHAGAGAARNRGCRSSQGEYVLFLDADVTLHPRMLERMVATLDTHPQASFVYCSFRFGWRTFDLFDFDPIRLRRANYISTMSLIRRQDFPGFDETIDRLQDWDLWLTMLGQNKCGVWIPARLFSAVVGRQSISRRISTPPREAVERIRKKHHLA